ncbi:Heme exporter protein B [Commensalibacter sp. Nvir]|uniref:heme exporter protein CcmB n=1 Tax=Commensalibacter sp. Nvir TaxID=3069817 RepID=UPI002D260238|nr:Heme exporter protein B [Commensalibacter sp. Nvir]
MMSFISLLYRELKLSYHHHFDTIGSLLSYVLIVSLFPLALGPEPKFLQQIAPGILWVCSLLSAILPLERLFNQDYEDGSLDQLLLLNFSTYEIALAKMISHWLTTGFPLVMVSIPLVLMYTLKFTFIPLLMLSLLIGTACLSLLGGMASCIALGARKNSFLLPLLIFPLVTPVLIFGTLITNAQLHNLNPLPHLELLSACFILSLPLCPLVAAAGLKLAMD